MNNHLATFWNAMENKAVHCWLCPYLCKIPEHKSGVCGIRKNSDGKLYASTYGQVSAVALDPIEKKPLYHFHPGKKILSIGGFGCNFRCPFCQNCEISLEHKTMEPHGEILSPEEVVAIAKQTIPNGNIGVAYTYNEPLIGYEFLYDCAKLVHEAGLFNVVVTNGYINSEPLEKILPFIDAMNIDLKGFTEEFYRNVGGGLEAVKEAITTAGKHCHVEVTTLVIPGENEDEIEEQAQWLASINPNIPLHLTRFFPCYNYSDKEPTPVETLYRLQKVAKKYLNHVFIGNV